MCIQSKRNFRSKVASILEVRIRLIVMALQWQLEKGPVPLRRNFRRNESVQTGTKIQRDNARREGLRV